MIKIFDDKIADTMQNHEKFSLFKGKSRRKPTLPVDWLRVYELHRKTEKSQFGIGMTDKSQSSKRIFGKSRMCGRNSSDVSSLCRDSAGLLHR